MTSHGDWQLQRSEKRKPRVKPWVAFNIISAALKGRDPTCVAPSGLCKPSETKAQGVALGFLLPPLRGEIRI
jgi:hypothetical protein